MERRWDPARPTLLFIGLNPSRADAERDDPTLRRLQAFARAWGYGGLEVLNLFARISASPAVLRRSADPVGPENDRWLEQRLRALQTGPAGGAIWLGWGNGGVWRGRDQQVLALLASSSASSSASASASRPPGCPWLALGLTALLLFPRTTRRIAVLGLVLLALGTLVSIALIVMALMAWL